MLYVPENYIKEYPINDAVECMKGYSDDGTDLLEGMIKFRDADWARERAMNIADMYPLNCYNTVYKGMSGLFGNIEGDK